MYAVSIPIVLLCMVVAFVIMLFSFWAEDYVKQAGEDYQQFIMLPSIIYTLIVMIMNAYYRKFATYLTEWGKSFHFIVLANSNYFVFMFYFVYNACKSFFSCVISSNSRPVKLIKARADSNPVTPLSHLCPQF